MEPVSIKWIEDMQFVAVGGSGHALVIDAGVSNGGRNTGPRPTEMLLMAFGGCTGIDIVDILKKGHVNVDRFEMRVKGTRDDSHPRRFLTIELEYLFWGDSIPVDKVERAIALSNEKYCSVGASLSAEIVTRHQVFSTVGSKEELTP